MTAKPVRDDLEEEGPVGSGRRQGRLAGGADGEDVHPLHAIVGHAVAFGLLANLGNG
jgi:hypothetical protein